MTACGTQTVAERAPAATAADGATATQEGTARTATTPAAPAPTAPATTAAPAAPATTAAPTPTRTTPAPNGGAPAGGGAATVPGGDEAGNRVPVSFVVAAGATTPAMITVPPFLGILLRGSSGDGRAHSITLRTPSPATLDVPAAGTRSRTLEGLPAGTYAVDVDGRAAVATLRVADGAVGP